MRNDLFDPKDISADMRQYFEETEVPCGAPWVRVVEKPDMSQRPTRASGAKMDTDAVHVSNNWQGVPKSAGQAYQEWRNANPDTTTGWTPTCACPPADPIPCTVLDPFGGSGTTVAVAVGLGRRAILVELNASYIDLAERRISAVQRPLPHSLFT